VPALGSIMQIHAPLEAVFDLASDYDRQLRWDPLLREASFVRGTAPGTGSRVRLRYAAGLSVTLEYFGFTRPSVMAVKMVRGPRYFRQLVGSWHFRALEDGDTEVTFKCVYEARYPWIGWLCDPLVFRVLARANRKRLRGLKRGAEELGLIEVARRAGE